MQQQKITVYLAAISRINIHIYTHARTQRWKAMRIQKNLMSQYEKRRNKVLIRSIVKSKRDL